MLRQPPLHVRRETDVEPVVLSGMQKVNVEHPLVFYPKSRVRRSLLRGFELDHRPDDHAHCRQRLLKWMELREQRGLDAGAVLVVRPKPIAKRLDHMVGSDAEIRVAGTA